jgi:hypothetical protein
LVFVDAFALCLTTGFAIVVAAFRLVDMVRVGYGADCEVKNQELPICFSVQNPVEVTINRTQRVPVFGRQILAKETLQVEQVERDGRRLSA